MRFRKEFDRGWESGKAIIRVRERSGRRYALPSSSLVVSEESMTTPGTSTPNADGSESALQSGVAILDCMRSACAKLTRCWMDVALMILMMGKSTPTFLRNHD